MSVKYLGRTYLSFLQPYDFKIDESHTKTKHLSSGSWLSIVLRDPSPISNNKSVNVN